MTKKDKLKEIYDKLSTPDEKILDLLEDASPEKIAEVYDLISTDEELIIDALEKLQNEKPQDGKTPTNEELEEIIKPLIPKPLKGDDGKTPTEEELIELIKPLIPKAIPGKDGNIITPQEVIEKIKEMKGKKGQLSVFDLADVEWLKNKEGMQWSSAGFSVYHDDTMTGDGSFGNPLKVKANSISEKVSVSSSDTTAGFLQDKIKAGTGITITQENIGGNEDLKIATKGYLSAGCVTMASYTDNGNGTLTTGAHVCRLFPNADGSGLINEYSISGGTFSLTDQINNYLVADYNGGSPILRVITDVSLINETTIIPLRTIFRNGNNLHQLDWDELGLALSNKLNKRLVKTERFARENGLILGTSGLTTLVSAGSVWYGAVNANLLAVDSSVNEFFFYYHNAGNWQYDLVTGFPNLYWDDGTNRQTLGANKYGAVFVYRGIETDPHIYCVVDGTNNTLTGAQLAQPPVSLPPIITAHCMLVGRIIFQKSAVVATQVDSAFNTSFTASGVPNHNDLTGLQGGTVNEYYHMTDAQNTLFPSLITAINPNTFTADQTFDKADIKPRNSSINILSNLSTPATTPGASLVSTPGNIDNGTHYYTIKYYTKEGDGAMSTYNARSVVISNNTVAGQVDVTYVASTNPKVIGIKIFRTTTTGSYSGRYWLIKNVASNTSGTFRDNLADTSINMSLNVTTNEAGADIGGGIVGSGLSDGWAAGYNGVTSIGIGSNNNFFFEPNDGSNTPTLWFDRANQKLVFANRGNTASRLNSYMPIYSDIDEFNPAIGAMYIGASGRLYLGDSTHSLYSVNFKYVSNFESLPSVMAMSASTGGTGDGYNSWSTLLGSSSGLILYNGSFTSIISAGRQTGGMRSFPFGINPTDGDGYLRPAGYILTHDNTSLTKKGTFTGTGLNDLVISNVAGTITGADNTGVGHTYDVKITTNGTPDKFQYSVDGGAYNGVDISITGADQTLTNGVKVKFTATTGHTIGDITRVQTYFWTRPHTRWAINNEATPIMDLSMKGALSINTTKTTVNGSTSGSAIFSPVLQGSGLKTVEVYCNALNGTATYTFPTAFTYTPQILSQNLTALVTAISTTSVTITGVTSTGFIKIDGF